MSVPKMSDRCIQKLQLVLQTKLFELCSGCRIKFCAFTTVLHINLINILISSMPALADIFVQGTAKIIGNIIFPI